MNLYFDLDAGFLISSPGNRDLVSAVTFKRGDNVPIALRFVRGTTITELASGATGVIGIKQSNVFDGDFIAFASSWVKTGSAETTVYNLELNLNTAEIDALLGLGEPTDVPSVLTNFELEFVVNGVRTSSNTVVATIQNDIVKGTEGLPAEQINSGPHTGINTGDETRTSILRKIGDGERLVPNFMPNAFSGDGPPQNGTRGKVRLQWHGGAVFENGATVNIVTLEDEFVFTKVASSNPGPFEFTGSTAADQALSLRNAFLDTYFGPTANLELSTISGPTGILTYWNTDTINCGTAHPNGSGHEFIYWDNASPTEDFVDGLFPLHSGQMYYDYTNDLVYHYFINHGWKTSDSTHLLSILSNLSPSEIVTLRTALASAAVALNPLP